MGCITRVPGRCAWAWPERGIRVADLIPPSGGGGWPPRRWIERILPYALLASAVMSLMHELINWYLWVSS